MKDWPFETHASSWYQVGWSAELAPGEVKPLRYFDEDLIVYRGESGGPAQVLGATCPHLGAHLGYGGTVCGDEVQCPFHGWRYGADGHNTFVPNSKRGKFDQARVRPWPTREVGGIILVWYDVNGDEPTWEWPGVPEFSDPDFYPISPHGTHDYGVRAIQPQSMLENAADTQHFPFVHSAANAGVHTEMRHEGPFISVKFALAYGARDDGKPTWLTPDGPVDGEIHAEGWGLGLMLARAWVAGTSYPQLLAITPVDLNHGRMFGTITTQRVDGEPVPSGTNERMFARQHAQVGNDIPIFEHQRWLDKPLYSEFEGTAFTIVRKFALQFYPPARTPTPTLA